MAIVMGDDIDVKETRMWINNPRLLTELLKDRTTGKNIIWATDNYKDKGIAYNETNEILVKQITSSFGNVIQPRARKSKTVQKKRSKDKAEIFTPAWVCNEQNNLVDNAWFGKAGVFNVEKDDKTWEATKGKVRFTKGKVWQDYVNDIRLEISCGEAPYLTSIYDTTTGGRIPIKERIGLLDRKLRIVTENTKTREDFLAWSYNAFKSIYAYEWQGDSLLIARENLLSTFCDFYTDKFKEEVSEEILLELADIVTWNVWQMDGLKMVVPHSCKKQGEIVSQRTFFEEEIVEKVPCVGCQKNDILKHNGIYCLIRDWDKHARKKKSAFRFVDLFEKQRSKK